MDQTPENFMIYQNFNFYSKLNSKHYWYLQSKKRMLKLNVNKAYFFKDASMIRLFKKLEGWG